MYARFVDFTLPVSHREEFVKTLRHEVLPILRKQPGFLEILPFFAELRPEKLTVISLWTSNAAAEAFASDALSHAIDPLRPYVTSMAVGTYFLETSLCAHFAELLAA